MSTVLPAQFPNTLERLQGYRRDRFLQINLVLLAILFCLGAFTSISMDSPGLLRGLCADGC